MFRQMTYRSKGEPYDEIIYFLARDIYRGKDQKPVKFNSWEECFKHHAGCTIQQYMEYAKDNKLKKRYIDERSNKS